MLPKTSIAEEFFNPLQYMQEQAAKNDEAKKRNPIPQNPTQSQQNFPVVGSQNQQRSIPNIYNFDFQNNQQVPQNQQNKQTKKQVNKGLKIEIDKNVKNPRTAIFDPKPATPNRLFSANLSKPVEFVSSNNLIKKPGSFYQAKGDLIYIRGKVTDSFGVPISGALIEMWQTNAAGKYQSLLDPNSEFIDVNFNMSGRAISDNLGNYHFLTIMPGFYLNRAPHVNMNIYHKEFGKIETEMYFEGHPRNNIDYEYLSYSDQEKHLLTAQVILSDIFDQYSPKLCTFNIVMEGIHKYKSFGRSLNANSI